MIVQDPYANRAGISSPDPRWNGENKNEKGIEKSTGKIRVVINPTYYRPTEVDILLGDASKARMTIKWQPKTKFHDLVQLMAFIEQPKMDMRYIR